MSLSDDTIEKMNEALGEPDPEQEPTDNAAAWILFVGFIIIVGALIWTGLKFAPAVTAWAERKSAEDCLTLDPADLDYDADQTFDFCSEQGFVPDTGDEPALEGEEWCLANQFFRADDVQNACLDVCTSLETCAVLRYELPEGVDPGNVPDYLEKASDVIDDMIGVEARMRTLEDMALAFGSAEHNWLSARNDKQWLDLYKDIEQRMYWISNDLLTLWPPPPYNSASPLLDAHGRIMNAYLYLDQVWDDFEYGYHEGEGWYLAHGHREDLEGFSTQIDYARQGLNMAR